MPAQQHSAQYKRGLVTLLDPSNKYRVRVQFADEDGTQSFWLSVVVKGAKGNRHGHVPQVGEQVACLVDWRGEDGIVLGSVYSEQDPTPLGAVENDHVTYADGAVHEHDPVTNVHRTTLPDPGKLFLKVGTSGPTKMLITKDGIVVNKPISLGDVPDIPTR